MKRILSLSLALILITLLITGCKKDKGDPPILPPAESMTIDFSNFTLLKKSGDLKGTENSAWEFSAGVAGIFRVIINTTLIVPVASFQAAVNQTPVYLSKNNWQWSYNITVLNNTYKARLTGEIRTSDVAWKMYVSKEGTGAFPEFLWFEGTSLSDGTGGQWILNQSSAVPTALLQIDWTRTASTIGKITYTYVKNGDALKSSYIEYGLTGNTLNAYYKIHFNNSTPFTDVDVEWNTALYNGRVKCTGYLGDALWHCWEGVNKTNVACP